MLLAIVLEVQFAVLSCSDSKQANINTRLSSRVPQGVVVQELFPGNFSSCWSERESLREGWVRVLGGHPQAAVPPLGEVPLDLMVSVVMIDQIEENH